MFSCTSSSRFRAKLSSLLRNATRALDLHYTQKPDDLFGGWSMLFNIRDIRDEFASMRIRHPEEYRWEDWVSDDEYFFLRRLHKGIATLI
jgi:hypothetical protein